MTKEQFQKIRENVRLYRTMRVNKLIKQKVKWSETACQSNWLKKFLFNLPNKTYTEQEAFAILEQEEGYSALIEAQNYGWKVLDLVTAIETAERLGLEKQLHLTADDIDLLASWE